MILPIVRSILYSDTLSASLFPLNALSAFDSPFVDDDLMKIVFFIRILRNQRKSIFRLQIIDQNQKSKNSSKYW